MKRKRKRKEQTPSAEAYRNSGDLKQMAGLFRDAITDYDKALEIKPNYLEAYYNKGQAKSYLEQHEAAIAGYDKAIRLNPNVDAYYNRGRVKEMLGRFEDAIADFKKAIRQNPSDIESHQALSRVQANGVQKGPQPVSPIDISRRWREKRSTTCVYSRSKQYHAAGLRKST